MKFLIAGLGSIGRRHFRNLIALGEKDVGTIRVMAAEQLKGRDRHPRVVGEPLGETRHLGRQEAPLSRVETRHHM